MRIIEHDVKKILEGIRKLKSNSYDTDWEGWLAEDAYEAALHDVLDLFTEDKLL